MEKTLSGLRRVMEGTTKKIAESTKCYICSFISLSKNKVYIFEKTSADLAGIIRLSLEIDVNKYSEDSKLFVCRECFQQLTKYERAAKKLQEIKQELLSTCRNREQQREKRLAREERSRENNNGDVPVSASVFSETSHVNFDPAGCISYCYLDFLQSPSCFRKKTSQLDLCASLIIILLRGLRRWPKHIIYLNKQNFQVSLSYVRF